MLDCPKCFSSDLIETRLKYTCKNCSYEILKEIDKKDKCKYCYSNMLVTLQEYYKSYSGKYDDKYMCYVCKEEQFTRPEK